MAKEKAGALLFAGLLGLTGLVSSGAVVDVNPWLERWNQAAIDRDEKAKAAAKNDGQSETDDILSNNEAEKSGPADETPVSEPTDPVQEGNATESEVTATEKPADAEVSDQTGATEAEVNSEADTDETVLQEATQNAGDTDALSEEATVPTFDVLRVEPDGSTVIAGIAEPLANIELVAGTKTLTDAKANNRGEFVAVLDEPLSAGDYEIVLRATAPDGTVMTSAETAIVSIPENNLGEVLALVEAPGAPSRLITKPSGNVLVPVSPLGDALSQNDGPLLETENSAGEQDSKPEEQITAVEAQNADENQTKAANEVSESFDLRIEAVEIDGPTVFVAGSATKGSRIRVYANEILLGDAIANADGRFLVDVNREIPVGDYLIRADVLSGAAEVLARVAVPFTREEGEKIAAIAVPIAPQLPNTPPEIEAGAAPIDATGNEPKTETGVVENLVSETTTQENEVAVATPSQPTQDAPAEIGEKKDRSKVGVNIAERLAPASESVIIRRGDTLWQISRRVYGRGIKYTTIYAANQDQIKDPNRIWPGQVFNLPKKAETAAE